MPLLLSAAPLGTLLALSVGVLGSLRLLPALLPLSAGDGNMSTGPGRFCRNLADGLAGGFLAAEPDSCEGGACFATFGVGASTGLDVVVVGWVVGEVGGASFDTRFFPGLKATRSRKHSLMNGSANTSATAGRWVGFVMSRLSTSATICGEYTSGMGGYLPRIIFKISAGSDLPLKACFKQHIS